MSVRVCRNISRQSCWKRRSKLEKCLIIVVVVLLCVLLLAAAIVMAVIVVSGMLLANSRYASLCFVEK